MSFTVIADPLPLVTDEYGAVRVGNSRVILELVIYAFQEGATAEKIVAQYPSLDLADVYSVLGYYLRHQAEVDEYIQKQEEKAAQIQQKIEAQFNPVGLKKKVIRAMEKLNLIQGVGEKEKTQLDLYKRALAKLNFYNFRCVYQKTPTPCYSNFLPLR
jgi:uncharacterized protein (DUF433 family)